MMRSRMQGLTLVELMVAMVLGLVVIGGAVSLTLANRQSFQTNEGLSQLQESARTAFELVSRDIRQAGVTGCENPNAGRIASVLDDTDGEWWLPWIGMVGYEGTDDSGTADFGTDRGERVSGTHALQLQGVQGIPWSVDTHSAGAATIKLATAADITVGDVMVVCDFDHATVFQVTSYNAANFEVGHSTGVVFPGNSTSELGFPVGGGAYPFPRNSQVGRYFATEWYVGQSDRAEEGGRSLFRRRIAPGGTEATEEIVAGVTDLQFTYRVDGGDEFLTATELAAAGANWNDVSTVQVQLTVESADTRVSTELDDNSGRLSRSFSQIVTLRNRVP